MKPELSTLRQLPLRDNDLSTVVHVLVRKRPKPSRENPSGFVNPEPSREADLFRVIEKTSLG